jgi:hypothetical protein
VTEQVIEGYTPPDQAGTYRHLPFVVPPGTGRIEVRYAYDAAIDADPLVTGGNTVDIGVFDQRGVDYLDAGFRGWSGSARPEFFITPHQATPGYIPGPISPGTWHICLGFYKIDPSGCNFRVTVRCLPGDPSPQPSLHLLTLAEGGSIPPRPGGWYRGDLHCHTYHSDGDASPAGVVRAAETLGLDFLAITDHNTISALAALARLDGHKLMLIPGCEMTTYKGHWNAWGLSEWVDFRSLTAEQLDRAMRHAAARGALVSCNHPRAYGPSWAFPQVEAYSCVEVWNGPWMLCNWEALAFWEERLRRGRRLTAVGGSDAHYLHAEGAVARLGTPTTWVHCPGPPTAAGILDGLRAGHAFISERPGGPQLFMWAGEDLTEAMMGDAILAPPDGRLSLRLRAVGGAGLTLELHDDSGLRRATPIESDDAELTLALDMSESRYVRAQLAEAGPGDTTVVRALTNPIYLSA